MKYLSICSVMSKSAITPSFIGRTSTRIPGVRPSICLASAPTASMRLLWLFTTTTDGSRTTMPFAWVNTSVFAVPRSIARSLENQCRKRIGANLILLPLLTAYARGSGGTAMLNVIRKNIKSFYPLAIGLAGVFVLLVFTDFQALDGTQINPVAAKVGREEITFATSSSAPTGTPNAATGISTATPSPRTSPINCSCPSKRSNP